MRPAFFLLILLSSCMTAPVAGVPLSNSEAAIRANATINAVNHNMTATAGAGQATINAVMLQGTEQASAATSTRQAEYNVTATVANAEGVVSAELTREHGEILQEREQVASAATAVFINGLVQADARNAAKSRDYTEFLFYARYVFLIVVVLMFTYSGILISKSIYYRALPDDPAVYSTNGEPAAVHRKYKTVPQAQPIQEETPNPPMPSALYGVTIDQTNYGMSVATFKEPINGAFKNWLEAVLLEGSRVYFSQNRARINGWPDELFILMVTELKNIGWLEVRRDGNKVHRLNGAGRQRAREWLDPPTE